MQHIDNFNQSRWHSEIEKFLEKHSQTAFERYLEVTQLRKQHPELTLQQAFHHIYPKDPHTTQYLSAIKMINTRLLAGETIEDIQKLYPPQIEQTLASAVVEEQRSSTATKLRGVVSGQPDPVIEIIDSEKLTSDNIEAAKKAQEQDNQDYDKANQEFVDNINQHN
jgi:hypothetical protein